MSTRLVAVFAEFRQTFSGKSLRKSLKDMKAGRMKLVNNQTGLHPSSFRRHSYFRLAP
jgi:hypothetical protein